MADLRLGSLVAESDGDGPPVVLVHGLGGSSNSFQTLMGALEGYRALRPDLPGAGRSPQRPGRSGLAGLTDGLRDCLRAAGIARAHFVGHSMGTLICQHLAVRAPDLVGSLTLFGPILEPPAAARQALKERAALARSQGMAPIADAVSQGSLSPASRSAAPAAVAFVRESLMRQDPRGYAGHCDALSEAAAADLGAIGCPTLLVAGDADPIAPVAMARQIAAGLTGARLEILGGIAHWMMVEAPQRSAELLRSQIEQHAL